MKRLTFTFLTLVIPIFLFCQIEPFQKKFGGLDKEFLLRVAAAPDGNFIGGGNITSITSSNSRDVMITKFDINGNILSTWTLGHSGFETLNDVISLDDGSIIVAATTRPYMASPGVDNLFICRILPNGTMDWSKQFGDIENEISGDDIILTNDGNLLMTGLYQPTADSNEKGILLKMDSNGSILFRKQWDASSDFDIFKDVIEVSDGYVVTGYSDFIDPSDSNVKAIIAKFDFNGNLIWSNAYDDGSLVRPNDFGILANDDGTTYCVL